MSLETVQASPRAFLRLEKKISLRAQKRFARAEEACRRAEALGGVCFLTAREGEGAARALAVPRGDRLLFSLFEALPDEEAVGSLFAALRAFGREKGCARLIGPVAPDGSGFGMGVLREGGEGEEPWFPRTPGYYPALLEVAGLRETSRLLTLRRALGENPFPGAADWAARRGFVVRTLPLARRETLETAWQVCEDARPAGPEAFARVYGRVAELAPKGLVVVAFAGAEREDAAWALCVPEGRVFRVLQIQARRRWRGSPCAAAVLDIAWREARRLGAEEILVGTIDRSNPHSLPIALHAGFTPASSWSVYGQEMPREGGK